MNQVRYDQNALIASYQHHSINHASMHLFTEPLILTQQKKFFDGKTFPGTFTQIITNTTTH